MAVRSYDIRLDCGLAPCQSLTASSTFAMRYERGVHGGELRRQLVIVAESGSEAWRVAGAAPIPMLGAFFRGLGGSQDDTCSEPGRSPRFNLLDIHPLL